MLGVLLGIVGLFWYLIAPDWRWVITALEASAALLLVLYFIIHFETVKTFSSRRSTKFGTNSLLMVTVFLSVLGIVNFLFNRHYARVDFSEGGAYSLSPQTIAVLENLKSDIKISGFYKDRSNSQIQARDIFENYRYYSPKLLYEFIDPDKNPSVARSYGISEYDTVVVEALQGNASAAREERKSIRQQPASDEVIRSALDPPSFEIGKNNPTVMVQTLNEQELTGAIVRVSRPTKKVVYFVEGHGERGIEDPDRSGYSQVKSALEGQGFVAKKLLLISEPHIPSDAAVLIIPGPKKPYLAKEVRALEDYLKRGGQLFVLIDPKMESGLEGLLKEYGVLVQNDIILDPFSRLFGASFDIPIVNPGMYLVHDLTEGFNLPTFYPVARSVLANPDKEATLTFEGVIRTGPNSWATTRIEELQQGFNPDEDSKGPITIGAVVVFKEDAPNLSEAEKKVRLVIFGDSDFATNSYFSAAGNGDLFQNVVSWLAQEEDLISIRPKEGSTTTLMLTAQQGSFLFFFPVVILPTIILLSGLSIWRRRRRL